MHRLFSHLIFSSLCDEIGWAYSAPDVNLCSYRKLQNKGPLAWKLYCVQHLYYINAMNIVYSCILDRQMMVAQTWFGTLYRLNLWIAIGYTSYICVYRQQLHLFLLHSVFTQWLFTTHVMDQHACNLSCLVFRERGIVGNFASSLSIACIVYFPVG